MQIEDSRGDTHTHTGKKKPEPLTIKKAEFSRSILSYPANRNKAGHQSIQRSS